MGDPFATSDPPTDLPAALDAELGFDEGELRSLVARLAHADLDCALELSHVLLATEQMGWLAAELVRRGRGPIARAWLRRVSRELDTLHMQWLRSQTLAGPPVERRDSGWGMLDE
jgi:hypothetical protein